MLESEFAVRDRVKPKTEAKALYHRFNHPTDNRHWVKVLPGGVYTSADDEIIHTGLGSCVSVCGWDFEAKVGGMNHFLLPFHSQLESEEWHAQELLSDSSRYGCYAMEVLINSLLAKGAQRKRLKFKLFGGSHLMGYQALIGEKNIEFVLDYVKRENLNVVSQDLGGNQPRKLLFHAQTGQAWVKRIRNDLASSIKNDEEQYRHKVDKQIPSNNDVELF